MPEKDDPVITFLKADTHGRVNLLGDKETASAVRHYLGGSAFAELENMAGRTDVQDRLAVKSPPNLVFVPGVMGSLLRSETKGGVWWIDARTRGHLDDLQLKPDGAEDLDANNQIDAFAVDTCYEPFATAVLARDDFGHRHFAYDWRKSFSRNTVALRNLIVHMHATNGGQPVHIVAHSMGGLMARAALKEFGDELWPIVGRIVFIGTPHYGSPAIAGYLKNPLWGWDLMAVLGCIFLEPRSARFGEYSAYCPRPRASIPARAPTTIPSGSRQQAGTSSTRIPARTSLCMTPRTGIWGSRPATWGACKAFSTRSPRFIVNCTPGMPTLGNCHRSTAIAC